MAVRKNTKYDVKLDRKGKPYCLMAVKIPSRIYRLQELHKAVARFLESEAGKRNNFKIKTLKEVCHG